MIPTTGLIINRADSIIFGQLGQESADGKANLKTGNRGGINTTETTDLSRHYNQPSRGGHFT